MSRRESVWGWAAARLEACDATAGSAGCAADQPGMVSPTLAGLPTVPRHACPFAGTSSSTRARRAARRWGIAVVAWWAGRDDSRARMGEQGTLHPDQRVCHTSLRCMVVVNLVFAARLLMLWAPHRLSAAGGDAAPKAGCQAGGQGVGAGHARAGEKRRGRGRHGTQKDGAHVAMTSRLSSACLDTPTNHPTDCALASPLALPSLPGGAAGRQLHHGHVP